MTARDHTKDTVITGLQATRRATPLHDVASHAILNALMFLVMRTPDNPTAGAPPERPPT